MEKRALKMTAEDNVATVLTSIKSGDKISVISNEGLVVDSIVSVRDIKFGFKISLEDISEGKEIVKYGVKIGTSYKNIKKGELVHIQNIKSNRINIPSDRIELMVKDMGI